VTYSFREAVIIRAGNDLDLPIVMLTGGGDEVDKIVGLAAGRMTI